MKIGFFGINFGVCGDPVAMIQVAKAAEQAGLESVWTGEHVVLPDPRFEQRGAVTNEAIEAIKALWTMEKPTYQGQFFSWRYLFAGLFNPMKNIVLIC